MKKFLANRWFLILLMIALAVGITAGPRWKWLADTKSLRDVVVAVSLFLMALPLEPRVIWRTVRRPLAPALAVLVNFGILPLAAWAISPVLGGDLAAGLLVASTTPCTMASAAVWTRRAGGNDAVATLVTLVTNSLCFLVTPAWLALFLGRRVESGEFDFWSSAGELSKLVVFPMVVAQLCRIWRPMAEFAGRRKVPLSVLTQCGILYMVLMGAIQTGERLFGRAASGHSWGDFLLMLVAVNAVHLSMFWVGWRLADWFRLGRADQIAVGFAGSQKTLMVGLKISIDSQVSPLPMVAFHVAQLLVDTIIADRLAKTPSSAGLDRNATRA